MNKINDNLYTFEGQQDIVSPQLVYYPAIIRENIRKMIDIAGGTARLWPHIKTHKMAEVVQMQIEAGIDRFKCATIAEAEMAAKAGAKHLTLAYPLVGPNIKRFAALQAAFPEVEFFAIGDDTEQIRKLGQTCKANVLMDVDMGQHRTGVPLDKVEAMYREWNTLPGIVMRGMHCYDGHRHESSVQEREVATAPVDQQIEEIKARGGNVPKDTISNAILKGTGQLEGVSYEEIRYEGYGIGGAALIIDCTTDNRVRTVADVRHALTKHGGNLGTEGSVSFMFKHIGEFVFAPGVTTEDAVMEIALEAGADDVVSDEDGSIEVTCEPAAFDAVSKAFEAAGIEPVVSEITYKALNEVKLTGEDAEKMQKLIDALEDLDDVQQVYTSADFDDEE